MQPPVPASLASDPSTPARAAERKCARTPRPVSSLLLTWTWTLVVLAILFLGFGPEVSAAQLIRDARCFLENGATAAHLFVAEDARVGETIGVLGVIGDPLTDIELRLQEHDSPVSIAPNSRNLTLSRPLDKEGIEGPSSVYVNVVCERRHTLDPGFVIPVNIRVTDANDNAPRFINAPYVLNISEVTVVGTRVLQGIRAIDIDQPGPFSTVQYSILPGPHSEYFVFVNALEGTLVLRKSLDYEKLSNFTLEIRAQDQGSPPQASTTELYVNVIDADDQNPAFLSDQYRVTVPGQIKTRKILRVEPEPIKAVDQDVGIGAPVRYSIQGGILPFLSLSPESADLVITRSLQENELLSAATLVVKATQIDNPDRYALATVVVAREGQLATATGPDGSVKSPIRFLSREYRTSLSENSSAGTILIKTAVNRPGPELRYRIDGTPEDLELFSVNNAGELILKGTLDHEKRSQYAFVVHVSDSRTNDTARVNVTVTDVNEWEPRFRHPKYDFQLRTMKEGMLVGRLEAADGDRGDRVRLSLRGPDARAFEIRDNGELLLRTTGPFNGSMARLVAIASDSGTPSKSSMIPVVVHLPSSPALPVAARATPAWLGSSVLLVAVFAGVLGLLGVVILILVLYIYRSKRPKNGAGAGSGSSGHDGYREKSPVPSALSPTPQIIGASMLPDPLELGCGQTRHTRESNDIDNPMFTGDDYHELSRNHKGVGGGAPPGNPSRLHGPLLYARSHNKVAPAPPEPPALSATSNIPNIGGLVQNMNDLSARSHQQMDSGSHDSSNLSGDPPDSLAPPWPAGSASSRVKKLSWDDDDDDDDVDDPGEPGNREDRRNHREGSDTRRLGLESSRSSANHASNGNPSGQQSNERLNLTVYF